MTTKTAYLAFMADSPIIGLNPQPSWAPQEDISSFDADGYIKVLGANTDRAQIEKEVREDHEVRLAEVEAGNLEDADDMDDIFEIAVHDDGRIEVIHEEPRYTFAEFTVKDVFEAYGMTMPEAISA